MTTKLAWRGKILFDFLLLFLFAAVLIRPLFKAEYLDNGLLSRVHSSPARDSTYPHKYDGVLDVIYDDHAGNRILRIPRRYPVRARVVETARLNALHTPRANDDVEYLKAYAGVIEKGPDSQIILSRPGAGAIDLHADLAPGQSLVVQESYDPAWHAWSGDTALAIRKDAMGFMAIDAPPGSRDIRLAFVTPLENQVGRVLTAISAIAVLALLGLGIHKEWTA